MTRKQREKERERKIERGRNERTVKSDGRERERESDNVTGIIIARLPAAKAIPQAPAGNSSKL